MSDRAAAAATVLRILGRQLVAVTEARHWFNGERGGDADSLIHFWLHFDGAPPLMAHGCGEHLLLEFSEPYASYDMQEHGETRVASAKAPDLLAGWLGQRLLDAALIQGYTTQPAVSGVQLRFERGDLVVASLGDAWVLVQPPIPGELMPYLTAGEWLAGGSRG